MTDDDIESRVRSLEIAMSSHVAECTQYRKSTEDTLRRIEEGGQEIKQQLHESNRKLAEHLTVHQGRRSAWSDTRILISFAFGVVGIVWGIIQTLL